MKNNKSKELINICVRCQKQKLLEEMVPDKRRPRGHQGYCKKCDRLEKKQRRINYTWQERRTININALTCRRTGKSPGYTVSDINYLWNKYQGRCYYCGQSVKTDKEANKDELNCEFDHVIPGLYHNLDNLVICCHRCNILKHANTLETLRNFIEKIEKHLENHNHLLE